MNGSEKIAAAIISVTMLALAGTACGFGNADDDRAPQLPLQSGEGENDAAAVGDDPANDVTEGDPNGDEAPPATCPKTADCSGRECGPDPVCGIECGECTDPVQICWPSGICAPDTGGGCGDMSGLQAGAGWPMQGYCPAQQRRTPNTGAAELVMKWELSDFYEGLFSYEVAYPAVVAADGTLYTAGSKLRAYTPDGIEKWSYPSGDLEFLGVGTPAIGRDGTLYFGAGETEFYAMSPGGEVLWTASLDDYPTGAPTVDADGTIYARSDTALVALNPYGSERWRYSPASGAAGMPAIGNGGTLYFSTGDGYLNAVRSDGTEQWRRFVGGNTYSGATDAVVGADGTIYVGCGCGSESETEFVPGPFLQAYDPAGNLKWEFRDTVYGTGASSNPAIGSQGTIYIGTGLGVLFALNPDGTKLWDTMIRPHREIYSITVGGDETLYVRMYESPIVALDSTGVEQWSFAMDYASGSPIIAADGTIYASDEYEVVYAFGAP